MIGVRTPSRCLTRGTLVTIGVWVHMSPMGTLVTIEGYICHHSGCIFGAVFGTPNWHPLARGLGWWMTGCLLWTGHDVCMFTYRLPSPPNLRILIGFSSFFLLLSFFSLVRTSSSPKVPGMSIICT